MNTCVCVCVCIWGFVRRNDILLVRKDYSLGKFLNNMLITKDKDSPTIHPRVVHWKDGSEILGFLKTELLL